eukprot:1237399-Amorphochlora_amoeboformis.AAC.1
MADSKVTTEAKSLDRERGAGKEKGAAPIEEIRRIARVGSREDAEKLFEKLDGTNCGRVSFADLRRALDRPGSAELWRADW